MSTERHEYVNTSPQSPPVPPRRRRWTREHLPSAAPAITAHYLHEATPCPGCAGPSLLRGEPGRLRDTHPAPPDPQLRRPKKRGRGWDGPLTQGHGGRRWKRCFAQRRQRLSDEAAAPGHGDDHLALGAQLCPLGSEWTGLSDASSSWKTRGCSHSG